MDIEIINSREKEEVVKVLQLFTNVETVARDFSLTYKNAKQIVDRFHIFKNFTDDLCNYLKRTVSDKIKLIKVNDEESKEVLIKRQQDKIDTANRKWEIIKEAKKLYTEGNTKTSIAKKSHITRVTLNSYLSLDDYMPLIKQFIIEGRNF